MEGSCNSSIGPDPSDQWPFQNWEYPAEIANPPNKFGDQMGWQVKSHEAKGSTSLRILDRSFSFEVAKFVDGRSPCLRNGLLLPQHQESHLYIWELGMGGLLFNEVHLTTLQGPS